MQREVTCEYHEFLLSESTTKRKGFQQFQMGDACRTLGSWWSQDLIEPFIKDFIGNPVRFKIQGAVSGLPDKVFDNAADQLS